MLQSVLPVIIVYGVAVGVCVGVVVKVVVGVTVGVGVTKSSSHVGLKLKILSWSRYQY